MRSEFTIKDLYGMGSFVSSLFYDFYMKNFDLQENNGSKNIRFRFGWNVNFLS